MPEESLKKLAVKSALWSSIGFYAVNALAILVNFFIIQIFTKEQYALYGTLVIVIGFSDIFKQCGIDKAIIAQENTDAFIGTAQTLSLIIGVLCYAVIWFVVEPVAGYFKQPELVGPVRLASLGILALFPALVSTGVMMKRHDFRELSFVQVAAESGRVGILLALLFLGYGVWSVSWGLVATGVITLIVSFIVSKIGVRFKWDGKSAKSIINLSVPLILTSLLLFLSNFLDQIFVGGEHSALISKLNIPGMEKLAGLQANYADYVFALFFAKFITTRIGVIINQVLLPTYAKA